MPKTVYIYSPVDTPRLRYVLELAFRHVLRCDYRITTHLGAYLGYEGPRINYGAPATRGNELRIPAHPLLRKTGIQPQRLPVQLIEGLPAFCFVEDAQAHLPFDLFSLVFFLVSRYEEYLPGLRDAYGRFEARHSMAFQKGFLEMPLAQLWILRMAQRLEAMFPGCKMQPLPFRFQPTFDVDQAWAYRYKPLHLQWAGWLKDAFAQDAQALKRRKLVLQGRAEDPFFTFADIEEWHRQPESDPIFFFHLGDYGKLDKNTPYKHPMLHDLIRRLHNAHRTGLHPSWKAGGQASQLAEEIRRFCDITGQAPVRSRQHYLRLSLPDTYRWLLLAHIHEDYSMGFAEQPGFRAGLACPFPWYDLKAERTTELMLHPFAVMDVTLKQYLGLSPEAALERALHLLGVVRQAGGVFCTLWHNSSFSDIGGWKSWRQMYLALKEAAENQASIA